MRRRTARYFLKSSALVMLAAWAVAPGQAQAQAKKPFTDILSFDHYVDSVSASPTLKGAPIKLFVRERIKDTVMKAGRQTTADGKAVLFVHGGTYPSVPDFDLPYQDYSWMAYLASEGFDVYSVDMTGYGKSSRPNMDDKCNVAAEQQEMIGQKPCPATFTTSLTTSESDWADIDAAVEFVRKQTGAAKINLVGWSGGGPRVGGYTALHGDKVARVVLFAPGYNRTGPETAPMEPTAKGPTMITNRAGAMERWDKAVKCENQYDPAIRDVIWRTNLQMDPVGAKWGPGVVRRPTISNYGWNLKLAQKFKVPVLMVVGDLDGEVLPERVRDLYTDVGSVSKVYVQVACGSHYVVYERGYKLLHEGSKSWFLNGTFNNSTGGMFEADAKGKISEFKRR